MQPRGKKKSAPLIGEPEGGDRSAAARFC